LVFRQCVFELGKVSLVAGIAGGDAGLFPVSVAGVVQEGLFEQCAPLFVISGWWNGAAQEQKVQTCERFVLFSELCKGRRVDALLGKRQLLASTKGSCENHETELLHLRSQVGSRGRCDEVLPRTAVDLEAVVILR
jgi:hypothetical protein